MSPSRFFRRRKDRTPIRRQKVDVSRPTVEELEQRTLLAAAAWVTGTTSVAVTGTGTSPVLTASATGTDITHAAVTGVGAAPVTSAVAFPALVPPRR